jgi:trans-aconitate 2-methyltransferase
MARWDPDIYALYRRYRERPAQDLMAMLPADMAPREIWDLGCGMGEQAAALAERFQQARVRGLDSSPEMLRRARALSDRVEWIEGGIEDFSSDAPADLIFTNAALHWVGDHKMLIPRLAAALAPSGVLAIQVPVVDSLGWRGSLAEVIQVGTWAAKLTNIAGAGPTASPEDYYSWLAPLCGEIDIWTTTYLHALRGEDPIVEWTMGATLRPYLDALDNGERSLFLDAWRARLARRFPRREDGVTLFPFKRLFIVARRSAARGGLAFAQT